MFGSLFGSTDKETTHRQTPALTRNGIRLGARIGSGGFGAVYRCTWRNNATSENEESAVKKIERSKLSQDYIDTHLQNEIDAIKHFKHPHIVTCKDVYDLDSCHYIVMELMGCSLDDLLDKVGSLPEARVKFYYRQFLNRDEQHNVLKIADFGLTRRCIDERTGYREMSHTLSVGTEDYRAPEILDPKTTHYDPLVSDVWSAGCVLYKMLYGRVPFSEPSTLRSLRLAQFVDHQRTTSVFTNKQNPSAQLKAFVNAHFHSLAAVRAKVDEIMQLEWIK